MTDPIEEAEAYLLGIETTEWEAERDEHGYPTGDVYSAEGVIASCDNDPGTVQQCLNAALIAAAPRLLSALIAAARADRERLAEAESKLAAARELHASFPGSPLASEVIAGQAAKIEAMSAELAAVTAERDEYRRSSEMHYGLLSDSVQAEKAAESALARAMEAMPTTEELPDIHEAVDMIGFEGSTARHFAQLRATCERWLARIDAFRASQAETKGGSNG